MRLLRCLKSSVDISKKNIFFIIGVFLYMISLVGAVSFPALSFWNYLSLSRQLFAFSICLSLLALFCIYISEQVFSSKTKLQMFGVYVLFCCIFISLLVRNILSQHSLVVWLALAEGFCILCGTIFWFCQLEKKFIPFATFKKWIINSKYLIFICFIVLVSSLEQINKYLRWDSISYYAYIERIKEFTFNPNDINMFKAAGHLSYGYVLLYTIGECLGPENGFGVRIENIFLFILIILILHLFLKQILPAGEEKWRLLICALFSVTPIILGPIHNIDCELLTLFLTLLILYFYSKDMHIAGLIAGIFFVFTKETCVILLSSFAIVDTLARFCSFIHKKKLSQFFAYRNLFRIFSLYFPLLFFLIHFCMGNGWGTGAKHTSADKFNAWGFNYIVIISKIKQLFIMNFSWIITIFIMLSIILICVFNNKNRKSSCLMVPQIVILYITFLSLQLFYITYCFPRYIMMQYLFMAIILQWIIYKIHIPIKVITMVVAFGIIIITYVQNFFSLDFISKNIFFNEINVGDTSLTVYSPILYLNNTTVISGADASFLIFSPYGDVNRQWSYFDVLFTKALNKINYTEADLIIFPDDFYPRTRNIYSGLWSDTFYDSKAEDVKQIMDLSVISNYDNLHLLNMGVLSNEDSLTKFESKNYDHIYYMSFPYTDIDDQFVFQKYPSEKEDIHVSYRGWEMTIYTLF